MRPRRRPLVLAVLVVLGVLPAQAHELGKVQIYATFSKTSYQLEMVFDKEHLAPAEEQNLDRFVSSLVGGANLLFDDKAVRPEVTREPADPQDPPGRVKILLSGPIPAGARAFRFSESSAIGSYPLVLKTAGEESSIWQWQEAGAAPGEPFALSGHAAPPPPTRGEVIRQYLALGFTHILPKGLDHILFVLGIFLLSRKMKPVLAQVTAFTVAHTLTLALTIYGVVSLPSSIVEPLIALSIAYVAIENVVTRELKARRIFLVFTFGLLHGMGFAGVLSQLGLPRSEFLPALVSFNLGVEAGQLTVIGTAFLLVGLPFRHRSWYHGRVVVPASCLIAAVGLFWSVQRAFF